MPGKKNHKKSTSSATKKTNYLNVRPSIKPLLDGRYEIAIDMEAAGSTRRMTVTAPNKAAIEPTVKMIAEALFSAGSKAGLKSIERIDPPPSAATAALPLSIAEQMKAENTTPEKEIEKVIKKHSKQRKVQSEVNKRAAEKYALFMEEKEQQLRNVQIEVLEQIVFAGNKNEQAIKDVIRCTLICAIKLKLAIDEVRLFFARNALFDIALLQNDFLASVGSESRSIMDFVSYIPVKVFAAAPFLGDLKDKFTIFKSSNPDLEKEILKLFPNITEELKAGVLKKIIACRQLVIQFSEGYFELTDNVNLLCQQHNITQAERVQLQKDVLQEMIAKVKHHVGTKIENNFCLVLLLKYENSIFDATLQDPNFSPSLSTVLSTALSKITLDDVQPLIDYGADLVEKAQIEIDDEKFIANLKEKIKIGEQQQKDKKSDANEDIYSLEYYCTNGMINDLKRVSIKELRQKITSKHLYLACKHNHQKIVAFLCKKIGFDETINDYQGVDNPLLVAAERNYFGIVKLLIEQSDIDLRARHKMSGETADEVATDGKVVQLLRLVQRRVETTAAASEASATASATVAMAAPKLVETDAKSLEDDSSSQESFEELKAYFEDVADQDIKPTVDRIKEEITAIRVKITAIGQEDTNTQLMLIKAQIPQQEQACDSLFKRFESLRYQIAEVRNRSVSLCAIKDVDDKARQLRALKKEHLQLHKKIRALHNQILSCSTTVFALAREVDSLSQAESKQTTEKVVTNTATQNADTAAAAKETALIPIDKLTVPLKSVKALIVAPSTLFYSAAVASDNDKLKLLESYSQFFIEDKKTDEKVNVSSILLRRIQLNAVLFETMQFIERRLNATENVPKSVDMTALHRMRNALVHSKGCISEALTHTELAALHQEVMQFCLAVIKSIKLKNDTVMTVSTFAKKLQAHGESLEQKRETPDSVTLLERIEYTFRANSQMILFLSYKPGSAKSLPVGMVDSALSMLNIKSAIYSLRGNPLSRPEKAREDRHLAATASAAM